MSKTTTTTKISTATSTSQATSLPRCSVRYDASKDRWAVVDGKTANPVKHVEYGIMTDVDFATRSVSEVVRVGCGSETRNGTVGIATGVLFEGTTGHDLIGWKNLGFNGETFVNEDGETLEHATKLRLMPGRRALYKL